VTATAAWTALTLARKGDVVMLGRRDFPALLYLLLGGYTFAGFLSKLSVLGYSARLAEGADTPPYISMLLLFAAAVWICLLDSATLLKPADERAAAAGNTRQTQRLSHRALAGLRGGRFWADFGL